MKEEKIECVYCGKIFIGKKIFKAIKNRYCDEKCAIKQHHKDGLKIIKGN